MPRLTRLWNYALVAVSTMGGCVYGPSATEQHANKEPAAGATKSASESQAAAHRVAPAWQQRLAAELAEADAFADAYGLFSEGGWSDGGQTLVVVAPGGKSAILRTSAPNKTLASGALAWDQERVLDAAELARIQNAANLAAGLADVDETGFDGMVYEFVHWQPKAGGAAMPQVKKRLFIKSMGKKPWPEHRLLIDAFHSLRSQPRPR